MQKYFVNVDNIRAGYVYFDKDDSYHIIKVMRMRINEKIIVSDNQKSYFASITEINNNYAIAKLMEENTKSNELPCKVTIAQGLLRKEKWEEVLQKLTQLGSYAALPVVMERSIVKLNDSKSANLTKRFTRIVKEASEQAQRNHMMLVSDPITFSELLKKKTEYDICLFASPREATSSNNFRKALENASGKQILVVVGPESGISDKEERELIAKGFSPISLGPRILRTETAPLYIMSTISYELELRNNNDL